MTLPACLPKTSLRQFTAGALNPGLPPAEYTLVFGSSSRDAESVTQKQSGSRLLGDSAAKGMKHNQLPEHTAITRSGLEFTTDFPWDEIDRAFNETVPDAREEAADGLHAMLAWVYRDGDIRGINSAFMRFCVVSALIEPRWLGNASFKEIGAQFGVTKQAVGAIASEFRKAHGNIRFRRQRPAESVERMRVKAMGHKQTSYGYKAKVQAV